jgi:hypothetical protein
MDTEMEKEEPARPFAEVDRELSDRKGGALLNHQLNTRVNLSDATRFAVVAAHSVPTSQAGTKVPRTKGAPKVGLEFETTGSISFEPGPYEGHLLKMESRSKQFTNKDEDGNDVVEDRSFIIWHFAIDEEGYEDVTLTAISSTSFGPKSKARRWAGSILRRKLADGEKVREDELKGRPVILNVDNEETERGTFAKVIDLSPVRSKKKAAQAAPQEEPELSAEDKEAMNNAFAAEAS